MSIPNIELHCDFQAFSLPLRPLLPLAFPTPSFSTDHTTSYFREETVRRLGSRLSHQRLPSQGLPLGRQVKIF